jgi:hypothetical protein
MRVVLYAASLCAVLAGTVQAGKYKCGEANPSSATVCDGVGTVSYPSVLARNGKNTARSW